LLSRSGQVLTRALRVFGKTMELRRRRMTAPPGSYFGKRMSVAKREFRVSSF
jgi:hypothetical protein